MKKVCFFMATPFSVGGEQRVVSIVSNMLIDLGYDVSIMCTDINTPRDYSLYDLNPNVKIEYVRGYNNKYISKIRDKRWDLYYENLSTGKYKNNLFMQKFINCDFFTSVILKNAFNKNDYDYVISLSTIYNTMLACISDKIKAKTIGWQHSSSERYFNLKGERHYNQDKFTKYMFKKLDSYVVLTEHDRRWLKRKYNVDALVINNPKSIISSEVSNLKNKQFLAVGRFVSVKNFTKLIEMFSKFHEKNKSWKLKIVGEGELKQEYLQKIKELKLQKYVTIENYTKNISKHYLSSSIYLMSSLYEGWGMVIGEAIEFGLPVISFNISSAPEMIKNDYNGYIVDNYNEEDYVKYMLDLANDKTKLKEFSKNSKIMSESKSSDIILKKWVKLFKKLNMPKEKVSAKDYVILKNKV